MPPKTLKVAYSPEELGAIMGMSAWSARAWVRKSGMKVIRNGRRVIVPLASIFETFPQLYDSMQFVGSCERDDKSAA